MSESSAVIVIYQERHPGELAGAHKLTKKNKRDRRLGVYRLRGARRETEKIPSTP